MAIIQKQNMQFSIRTVQVKTQGSGKEINDFFGNNLSRYLFLIMRNFYNVVVLTSSIRLFVQFIENVRVLAFGVRF